jgi:hypothetical protein
MTHLTALSLARLATKDPNLWGPSDTTAACGGVVHWVRYFSENVTAELIWISITPDGITPETIPTCPKCAVLLDQALEVAP